MCRKFLTALIAVTSVVLSSCQDEDYGFTKEEIRDSVYDRNFIAKYGEISKDQSWDLSKYAVNGNGMTRATVDPTTGVISCDFTSDDGGWLNSRVTRQNEWYYVDPTLVSKFTKELPEDTNNSSKGDPFKLTSNGTFYVIPLFQGASGIEFDLHMVVTDNEKTYDRCIWDKSSFIQKQIKGSFTWEGLPKKYDKYSNYHDNELGDLGEDGLYEGSTLYAKDVRSNPIKCEIPKGASVEFYLHITKGHLYRGAKANGNIQGGEHDGWSLYNKSLTENPISEANLAFTGIKQWSSSSHGTTGKMIALKSSIFDVDQSTKDKYGENVMLIGCEDAMYGQEVARVYNNTGTFYTDINVNTSYTDAKDQSTTIQRTVNDQTKYWEGDNDMNDFIFMVISANLPDVVETNIVKKRYIIEDLGSVVDWDFNDIVVDLEERTTGSQKSQKAILRHLCGTTPFELFVGEAGNESNSVKLNFTANNVPVKDYKGETHYLNFTNQSKISGLQMDRDVELSLECTIPDNKWSHANNNVWVKVYPEENSIPTDVNMTQNSSTQTVHVNGNNVPFPKQGEIPRIIATDTDFKWTAEDTDIESNMWTYTTISASPATKDENNTDVDATTGGTISGAGSYRIGQDVILAAIPKRGYTFVGWSGAGVSGLTDAQKKGRTISFPAAADMGSIVANFKAVGTISAGGNRQGGTAGDGLWSGIVITNDAENTLLNRLDLGYNTIKVNATGVAENSKFGIKRNGGNWEPLIDGDADDYYLSFNNGIVVLTDAQLAAIKNNGFIVQKRSEDNSRIESVEWIKTEDFYTVKLHVDDGAKIRATDRGPQNANNPLPYTEARYPAGVKAILTGSSTTDGYIFSHWTDTKDNYDYSNPVSIEADAELTAHLGRQLTIQMADVNKSEIQSITINGRVMTPDADGKVIVPVPNNENIKIKFNHKTLTNKYNVHYEIKNGETAVNTSAVANDTDVTLSGITAATTWNVTCTYQVQVYVKNDNPSNQYSNSSNPYGSAYIEYDSQNKGASTYLPKGASFKVYATPKSGYGFDGWYGMQNNATRESTDNPRTISRDASATTYFINAVFKPTYTLTINRSAGGNISVNPSPISTSGNSYTYISGTQVTVTATPESGLGYEWDDNGSYSQTSGDISKDGVKTRSLTVNANTTYSIHFGYKVWVDRNKGVKNDAGGKFSIKRPDGTTANDNAHAFVSNSGSTTIVATANSGYSFVRWDNGLNGTSETQEVTISRDTYPGAYFAKNLWTSTWGMGPGSDFMPFVASGDYPNTAAISALNTALENGSRTIVVYCEKAADATSYVFKAYSDSNKAVQTLSGSVNKYNDRFTITLTDAEASNVRTNGGFWIQQTGGSSMKYIKVAIY